MVFPEQRRGSPRTFSVPVFFFLCTLTMLFFTPSVSEAQNRECVTCHLEETPGMVADWEASRHSEVGVGCTTCHGEGDHDAYDMGRIDKIPTPETCMDTVHCSGLTQYARTKRLK